MKTKHIAELSLLAALNIVLSLINIHLGTSLQITLAFITSMIVGSEYSLKECIAFGIVVDVLGFFITQYGEPFFLGYTISSVLGLIIYWIFLHKEVSIKTIFLSRLTVNLLVNVVIGSIWRYMLYSKGYFYYLTVSFIKNITLLPIEILIFYLFYKFVYDVIRRK